MNEIEANDIIRGMVFAVQKTRSDLQETIGGDEIGNSILEDLHPLVFGPQSMLPKLVAWQDRCKAEGVIAGADLFNFAKLLEMKDPMILLLLPLYNYGDMPEPDISWFAQTWPYLEGAYRS